MFSINDFLSEMEIKNIRVGNFPDLTTDNKNQILLRAVIGAGVVVTILIFVFICHRVYVKKQVEKTSTNSCWFQGRSVTTHITTQEKSPNKV